MADTSDTINNGSRKTKSWLHGLLDGSLLTRQVVNKHLPFVFFITIFILVYIYNRYTTENTVREISRLQQELKDLRSESISITSELMFISNQTEISKLLKEKETGLEESLEPPIVIVCKDNEDK